jgi:deoxyribodipyrimidine photo-lyase
MTFRRSLVWLRRDLRLADNVALAEAARESDRVACAFVLSPALLRSDRVGAPIVSFFFRALEALRADLRRLGSELILLEGDFGERIGATVRDLGFDAVFFNEDYEPQARERDAFVTARIRALGAEVRSFTDHVYYGATEVLQNSGSPYVVFTPYKRRWLERMETDPRPPCDSLAAARGKWLEGATIGSTLDVPTPERYGHATWTAFPLGGEAVARDALARFARGPIDGYEHKRNMPALAGTSYLSPHLRAGTLGIRTCVAAAVDARAGRDGAAVLGPSTWLSELIWRDFYQQILYHFPHVAERPFRVEAERIEYLTSDEDWRAWCDGKTGYPIVDAGMRQLNSTGWMHNRLRMIVASFLTKDLLLDYKLGERYFEQRLIDADLGANNGGWQWSSSTGTDAAPYFRVFNPVLQSKRFDPEGTFIRAMLPELANVPPEFIHEPWTMPPIVAEGFGVRIGVDYPAPIVDHHVARDRALAVYGSALGTSVKS